MKNAKLVLFAMILSAPLLSMNGNTDDLRETFSRSSSPIVEEVTSSHVDPVSLCLHAPENFRSRNNSDEDKYAEYWAQIKNMQSRLNQLENNNNNNQFNEKMDVVINSTELAMHKNNARNLFKLSGLSALGLIGSIAVQRYAGSNAMVSNPKFAQVQVGLLGSVVTTTAFAVHEAQQAHPTVLADLWNSISARFASKAKTETASTTTSSVVAAEELAATTAPAKKATPTKKAAWLTSRNICAVSALALGGSIAAQKYAGNNSIVSNPKFVQAQVATGVVAFGSGMTAAISSLVNFMYNTAKDVVNDVKDVVEGDAKTVDKTGKIDQQ